MNSRRRSSKAERRFRKPAVRGSNPRGGPKKRRPLKVADLCAALTIADFGIDHLAAEYTFRTLLPNGKPVWQYRVRGKHGGWIRREGGLEAACHALREQIAAAANGKKWAQYK